MDTHVSFLLLTVRESTTLLLLQEVSELCYLSILFLYTDVDVFYVILKCFEEQCNVSVDNKSPLEYANYFGLIHQMVGLY